MYSFKCLYILLQDDYGGEHLSGKPVWLCTRHMYKRTQAPTGLQQRSQRDFLFEFLSDNMLPTSLMRAVSKTSTCSLIPHLPSSTLPSLSASLSTTSPASSLVQTEVDNMGIATVLANHVLGQQGVDEKQAVHTVSWFYRWSWPGPLSTPSTLNFFRWKLRFTCKVILPFKIPKSGEHMWKLSWKCERFPWLAFIDEAWVCTVYLLHENEF